MQIKNLQERHGLCLLTALLSASNEALIHLSPYPGTSSAKLSSCKVQSSQAGCGRRPATQVDWNGHLHNTGVVTFLKKYEENLNTQSVKHMYFHCLQCFLHRPSSRKGSFYSEPPPSASLPSG